MSSSSEALYDTSDLESDCRDMTDDFDDVTNIQIQIDQAADWLCRLQEIKHDTVLWNFSNSLEGRIRLERKSQIESGLALCYREFQVVLDALHAGCTLHNKALSEGQTRSSEFVSYEQRIKTLSTILGFYLGESSDFLFMVFKSVMSLQDTILC